MKRYLINAQVVVNAKDEETANRRLINKLDNGCHFPKINSTEEVIIDRVRATRVKGKKRGVHIRYRKVK